MLLTNTNLAKYMQTGVMHFTFCKAVFNFPIKQLCFFFKHLIWLIKSKHTNCCWEENVLYEQNWLRDWLGLMQCCIWWLLLLKKVSCLTHWGSYHWHSKQNDTKYIFLTTTCKCCTYHSLYGHGHGCTITSWHSSHSL